jgi:glycosyltransferase involved in cell wall biosynthesis
MSQATPSFSVVVPFRDEEPYLEKCIRALHEQDFAPARYELIFIDNGSTDRSGEIVREHQDIRYLQEPLPDPYLARNRGIERARGDYVAFTDADCTARPDWLSQLARSIEAHDAGIVVGRLAFPPNQSAPLGCYERYYNTKCGLIFAEGPEDCYYGHAGNMAVRRSLFDVLGSFAPMPVAGDTEFIHRVLGRAHATPIAYAPDAVVTHLEVTGWSQCLRKVFRYGTYSEVLHHTSRYRPLNLREKLAVLRRYRDGYAPRPSEYIPLIFALGTGWASFLAGRLWARARS